MMDLERSNAELRAAVILAGKRIVKLCFGRAERSGAADLATRVARGTK
jgi:hypothetical protein